MPWDAIEEASPAALIARLRAAGCPEQTTRWIVAFRVCRQYRERWLAWQAKAARAWDYTRKLEEYLYRLSPAADYVRNHLPPAKSEGEFRAMVKLALEMEVANTQDSPAAQYGLPPRAEPVGAQRECDQRKAAFDQRLKEVLREDRIAEQP